MSQSQSSFAPLLNRLLARVDLSQTDQAAVLALPQTPRILPPREYVIRKGDKPAHCCLMTSGFTIAEKIVADGTRQIVAVHMKGEMVDLQNVLLERSDHDVRALTEVELVIIPRGALQELAFANPAVGKALWLETLVDASVLCEQIANIGRRNARARLAHTLCEFAVRLQTAGLAATGAYELPMTQEQLADMLALTTIHTNRMLKELERDGLIERDKRSVRIPDWKRLSSVAGFDPTYLHLPQRKSGSIHQSSATTQ